MKVAILIIISLLLRIKSYEQEHGFSWKSNKIEIAAVQMKVYTPAKKIIFDGYKVSYVMIENSSGELASITINLAGYFEMDGVGKVEYKSNYPLYDIVSYNISDGNKECDMVMYFEDSKLSYLQLFTTADKNKKGVGKLNFVLKGFEISESDH
jgi:hypothetical protein